MLLSYFFVKKYIKNTERYKKYFQRHFYLKEGFTFDKLLQF